jgi:hypothetical protein
LLASALSVKSSTSFFSLASCSSSGSSAGSFFKEAAKAVVSAFNALYSSKFSGAGVTAFSASDGPTGAGSSADFSTAAATAAAASLLFLMVASATSSATLVASVSGTASSTIDGSAAVPSS